MNMFFDDLFLPPKTLFNLLKLCLCFGDKLPSTLFTGPLWEAKKNFGQQYSHSIDIRKL